jgi:hypothetical protein
MQAFFTSPWLTCHGEVKFSWAATFSDGGKRFPWEMADFLGGL